MVSTSLRVRSHVHCVADLVMGHLVMGYLTSRLSVFSGGCCTVDHSTGVKGVHNVSAHMIYSNKWLTSLKLLVPSLE